MLLGNTLCWHVLVGAQGSTGALSQGYQTTESGISASELVSVTESDKNDIQRTNLQNANLLLGVVEDKPLVALSSGATDVQVVITGSAPTLVTDFNGTVHAGDKIAPSPINGVGMKATAGAETVGTAQADFSAVQTVPFTMKNVSGATRTVRIGLVPVQVSVAYYAGTSTQAASIVPNGLQRIANAIAGREVSVIRVLVSLLIVLLGFVSTAVILYASVRTGITSVGRNPLAARAIHTSLTQVLLVVIGVMVAMIAGAYLVLAT